MEGIGAKLRSTRLAWKLTLRDVEERSLRLARQWDNPAYRISASWLVRVELENRGLSATKLIVLANIYSLTTEKMLDLCPSFGAREMPLELTVPNGSLLTQGQLEAYATLWLPDSLLTDRPPESTDLLPVNDGSAPNRYLRGIIGREDRTMEPMIPTGSIVVIDTQRTTIAGRRDWNHEFDRPIYFLLTRSGYFYGFCELDHDKEWLTLVPHALSPEKNRRWRYRKEVEVVGTVTAVSSRRRMP